jgi:hypothetical protein
MSEYERFLCNTPLKLELGQDIWFNIRKKGILSKDTLYKIYGMDKKNSDNIESALTPLFILNMIKTTEKGLICGDIPKDIDDFMDKNQSSGYKLLLLNKIRTLGGDYPNYKQQAHVLLTFKILSDQERGIIDIEKDDDILMLINREWPKLKYFPKSQDGPISLNIQKFHYWKELAVFLGLIYPRKKLKEFLVSISPELSISLVQLFIDTSEKIKTFGEAPIEEFIDFLKSRFLYIDEIRTGKYPMFNNVTQGMFLSIENSGVVKFVKEGDTSIYEISFLRPLKEINKLKI